MVVVWGGVGVGVCVWVCVGVYLAQVNNGGRVGGRRILGKRIRAPLLTES